MEYLSRLFAEGLESQEFTYHDEYTRCQGLHIFILCIMLKKTIFDKSFFSKIYSILLFIEDQKIKN